MSPRVTWLLPVRNAMPYLPSALASIEAQSFRDWDVLAWDNDSTDGSLHELQKWIPSRLPGRIVTGRALPLGACLAAMVAEGESEFCARMDADDVNKPERLERQMAFLDASPEVALVGCQIAGFDESGAPGHQLLYRVPCAHDDIVLTFLTGNPVAHPTVVFRRTAVLAAGNYRDVGPGQDYDLWMRLALRHCLANLEECLLHYRVHAESITQTLSRESRGSAVADARFVANAPALFGCSESEARMFRERRHPRVIGMLWRLAQHLRRTQGGSLWRRLRSAPLVLAGRVFARPADRLSRLIIAALDRSSWSFRAELRRQWTELPA